MAFPLMQKATAVWLVDNTALTFVQIAEFCGLHELEVSGIADGEVATGIRGMDPIGNTQLTQSEIKRCEADSSTRLKLLVNPAAMGEEKRRGPRYTPLSKRQDRPAAIAWLVKFHPELSDGQISKLVGTTKPTILTIRNRTHWNISNIQPIDPVALGLCKQVELDGVVSKMSNNLKNDNLGSSKDTEMRLVSTRETLKNSPENRLPSNIVGLEAFSLGNSTEESHEEVDKEIDVDKVFNLPKVGD
jgi:hypothetical protein